MMAMMITSTMMMMMKMMPQMIQMMLKVVVARSAQPFLQRGWLASAADSAGLAAGRALCSSEGTPAKTTPGAC